MSTGTEIVESPGINLARPHQGNSFALAEEMFPAERRGQIADYLGVDAEDPAMIPYLAICANYGLDPTMGQIWLIEKKEKAHDGSGEKRRLAPAVGRDGLLAIARRTPEFEGVDGQVVCEHDTFEVAYRGTKEDPVVLHEFARKPTEFAEEEDPLRYRGRILGAWAKVYLRGRRSTFYWADIKEHGQMGTGRGGEKYWRGAWQYTQAMILKSAQSHALRIALGVTGIVPADELKDDGPAEDAPEEGTAGIIDKLDLPEELRAELKTAVERVNKLDPNSWSPAKVKMLLVGRSVEDAQKVGEDVTADIKRFEEREKAKAAIPEKVEAQEVKKGDRAVVDGKTWKVMNVEVGEEGAKLFLKAGQAKLEPTFLLDEPVNVLRGE